ncbi:thiamine phosphate synthase [Streptococcus suis]|nr:thiamine phosphate synthase [Streptococcus suis]
MNRKMLQVYFICGTTDCSKGNFLDVLEKALQAGITCFQFREKGEQALIGSEKLSLAKQVQHLCHRYQVPLIINDDIELARAIDADGIHLGQGDLSVVEARQLFPGKIIGLSVGTEEEYLNSPIELVDYIGSGPVFPTLSKDDASPAIGMDGLKQLRRLNSDIPMVAIGGLSAKDCKDILQAGADGIALISAISHAEDPYKATKILVEGMQALSG